MSLDRAAALSETFFTVWNDGFMRGGLLANERFLVHGGSSAIGTIAIKLAGLRGEAAFNSHDVDFVQAMKEQGGADLILDMRAGFYIPRNLDALAMGGRLVQIAFLQGAVVKLKLMQVRDSAFLLVGCSPPRMGFCAICACGVRFWCGCL